MVALGLIFCPEANASDTVTLDLGGGEKMEFVWVRVTTEETKKEIKIGDFSNPEGKEPVRKELLWGPFEMQGEGWGYFLGKSEVTEAQWNAVMGEGKISRRPLTNQPYQRIQEFIGKLNSGALSGSISGLPRKGDGTPGVIRLPTESEWEYAAREGAGPDYQKQHPYGEDVGRYEVILTPGSNGKPRDVAILSPNKLGISDMLGNVREFVEGTYSAGGSQILRGGSYLSEKQEIRSSARTEQPPFAKDGQPSKRPDAGFRLCITASEKTSLGQAAIPVEKDSDPEDAQKQKGADQFQKASELINAALTTLQIIQLRTAQIARLEDVNSDGFANEQIAKLKGDLAEKTEAFEQNVAKIKRMYDENRGSTVRALSTREEQLKKQIAAEAGAIARNAAEALTVLKNRLGFASGGN